MLPRVRVLSIFAALVSPSCGFVGIDLLDAAANARSDAGQRAAGDAGQGGLSEGGVPAGNDGGVDEGGAPSDASQGSDASGARDGGTAPDSGAVSEAGVVADASVSDGSAPDAQTPAGCDVSGTYAVKFSISVSWPTGFVAGGAGTSVFWGRFTGTQSGNDLAGTLQPCGFTLPDFSLNPIAGNELYQFVLPNTLFDRLPPYIAAVPATFTSSRAFATGSSFSLATVAIQVGANLANPVSNPWPAVAALPTVDTDADGKPGATASYTNGGGYSYPGANMSGTTRSDRAYAATRFAFDGSGNNPSCSELVGNLNFSSFDTHVVGCRIAGGGDCTTAQRDQVDSSRPLFAPTSATMRAIEVAANTTCAAVRAALP